MNINFKYNIDSYSLYEVDEISSTNTYLKDNYEKFKNKSILLADIQTQGRGRLDHVWISGKDLTFSVIFNQKQNYMLPALACVKALEEYNMNTLIKWPNDIFYNGMKISGILIEDIYLGDFKASIVGIGINLTDKSEFNVKELGALYNIDKYELLAKIVKNYDILLSKSQEELLTLYRSYSLIIGKDISYNNIIYRVIDIDEIGALVLKKDDKIFHISYGDIDLIKK